MSAIIEYIWNNLLAVLGIVISLVAALYFYLKSIRTKSPVYLIRSNNLISDFQSNFQELQVTYRGVPVESITVTRIAFWNEGKETIDGTDITKEDPLRISVSEGKAILECSILAHNNKANRCICALGERVVDLGFDYLDYKNGAVVQIIHSGKSSDDVAVTGTIKGADKIKRKQRFIFGWALRAVGARFRRSLSAPKTPMGWRTLAAVSFAVAATLLGAAVVTGFGAAFPPADPSVEKANRLITAALGSFGAGLYLVMAISALIRNVPRGLEAFDQ